MIDVIHTKQGKSFLGLVAYLMEGEKGKENPDRVAWTQTMNLATSRPGLAARVMAATAMDQARLKQNAGVPNTGRRSSNHVLHYTLSWHEGAQPTREEMMKAVQGSLAVLGESAGQKGGRKGKKGRVAVRDQFATEHQVLVVAHSDTLPEKPHCHVVVNRVHPKHGVMLPSSDDFLKLSRWAEKFERDHNNGRPILDQRALNNEARDKGQKVYGEKRKSRDTYELEQHARDNHPEALKLQEEQRTKDARLARKSAETRARCRQEWKAREEAHRQRLHALEEDTAKAINTEARTIQVAFAERRKDLHLRQRLEVEAFEKKETGLLGQVSNALKQLVSLSGPVNVLWSQGARIEALQKAQRRRKLELEREERKAKREAKARILKQAQTTKVEIGQRYRIEREETILRHQMEKATLRASWKTRVAEREQAWEQHHQRMAQQPPERSYGRQTTAIDVRTRETIEAAQRLLQQRREELKEHKNGRGRGDGGIGR